MDNKDISIITWNPLPAPPERFVLIRYCEDIGLPTEYQASCLAWSDEHSLLRNTEADPDYGLQMDINAWAYFPYDPDSAYLT